MSSHDSVAVLGTGIMGAPMARNLARGRLPGARLEPHAGEGGAAARGRRRASAGTPAEAAAGAGVVLTMLTDADAVLDTAAAALGGQDVWVQASTVGIEGTERCAALAAERGVAFVDAPVLGTRQPAEDGKLIVLASGPDAQRERLAPLFDAVAARTLWLGEAGAGTRLKLVANTWVLSLVEGLAETLALAEGLGVPPQAFLDAIAGGPLDAGYAQAKGKGMIERDVPARVPAAPRGQGPAARGGRRRAPRARRPARRRDRGALRRGRRARARRPRHVRHVPHLRRAGAIRRSPGAPRAGAAAPRRGPAPRPPRRARARAPEARGLPAQLAAAAARVERVDLALLHPPRHHWRPTRHSTPPGALTFGRPAPSG